MGDLAVVYIEKTNSAKAQVQVEVQFAELKNL
jgi:hypothetical protein